MVEDARGKHGMESCIERMITYLLPRQTVSIGGKGWCGMRALVHALCK